MKKNLFKVTLFLLLVLAVLSPAITFASGFCDGTNPNDPSCTGQSSSSASASAQSCGGGLGGLLCNTQGLINKVLPVLVALGVVYFVWGVVQYVIGDSEEAKKRGRDSMIYGIIGLAAIIGLWGLVNIVVNTFSLNNNNVAPSSSKLQGLLPQ